MKKVFGIRHHGPGSSKSLQAALKKMKPDIVLIEGPPSATDYIPYIAKKGMKPPVALLIYNPDSTKQSAFYPFAQFSPEWVAMQYGLKKDIPVRFMDLPLGVLWKEKEKVSDEPKKPKEEETNSETPETTEAAKEAQRRKDPLSYIAEIGGYKDGERWWENIVEQKSTDEDLFEGILELMTAVREDQEDLQTEETLMREAYMRKIIRAAEKEGYEKIAIVCGAWHAPVLENQPTLKEDTARLKGIKKVKTEATWIPWTYQRLSYSSGYGAGIHSPAWYEMLFKMDKEKLVPYWMSRVAKLFRKTGQDASSAHVIEATRLAYGLGNMRGRSLPILDDFMESVQTIFCFGDATPLKLIEKELVIGDKMGKIPDEVPQLPLQKEILAEKKKIEKLAKDQILKLDLRKELHIQRSRFLHRLNLLNIPWGSLRQASGKGTFWEEWNLHWQPEYELNIIEASVYGNSVESACLGYIQKQLEKPHTLTELSGLLENVFLADVNAFSIVIQKLEEAAALGRDVLHFMDSLPRLVGLLRYSDVRKRDTQAVQKVLDAIIPRLFIGLPAACSNLNDDLANFTFYKIVESNNAIQTIDNKEYTENWRQMLERLTENDLIHAKIAAGAARILFESGFWQNEQMERNMSLALSAANKSSDAAAWVEGFLHGSALLLLHNESLFTLLDNWVAGLSHEGFIDLLPLLRRSFAHYSFPERNQLGKLAKDGVGKSTTKKASAGEQNLNMENVQKILPVLQTLLS